MNDAKPKRRWFRFSLRTLFALVMIIGTWLGYHVNWIRQRHAFAAQYMPTLPSRRAEYNWVSFSVGYAQPPPWSLRLFGEEYCPPLEFPRSEVQRFNELFPEAAIVQK